MPSGEPLTFADSFNRMRYIGESEEATRACIAETIRRLPEDVQEFALDGAFLSVGDPTAGFYLSQENLRFLADGVPWLIVLTDNLGMEDLGSVVAHELAHLWLGHDTGIVGLDPWAAAEEAAAAKVREWGFFGIGARPSSDGITKGDDDA